MADLPNILIVLVPYVFTVSYLLFWWQTLKNEDPDHTPPPVTKKPARDEAHTGHGTLAHA